MPLTVAGLLKDKVVLYIVLFFSVTNVIGYLMLHNLEAVLMFIVIGMLTTYFTRNMIVVMLTALIATNAIVGAQRAGAAREGFVEGKTDEDVKNKTQKKAVMDAKEKKKQSKPANKEGMEPGGNDAPVADAPAAVDEEESGRKPRIDYAATLESAYDNLDKLLGSDALSNMSADTQKLAQKQEALMANLGKLEPMIQKAGSMLEGLEASGGAIGKLIDKFGGLSGS